MKLAPGLQSHTTADAISLGSPKRPIGSRASIAFTISGSLFLVTATAIGVLMIPGQTALMRIPCVVYSSAAERVRPMTACLLAEYALRPFEPTIPPIDEQLTITPLPC